MRKYIFEAGLNVFTSFKTLIPVEGLEDLSKKDKHRYHIYGILSYDQAFFDTEKTKTTEKGIQVGLFTMSGGKKEYELPLWTILPDLDHSKVELNISFPPTKMNVCIKDEDFLKRHPEFVHTELDIMAQELFQCAAECFMQKQEFEERIERTVTDEQYKVIEEVYMWHPSIRNTSGKDEVAELYKSFGMTIFHDMLPRAKKAHELDELLRNAQREVQRIQEEIEELSCPTLRVEE